MHHLLSSITFLLISHITLCQDDKTYPLADLKELNGLADKWEGYWNNHNMDSMGTLLRDDVDFVNVAGQWLKGKKEAVEIHKERHRVVFKTSVWKTDSVRIKYVKPDLAIMHIGWGITGDLDPDGKARVPRHGIFTWVVMKENNQWLILAVHNVNIRETGAFMNSPDNK
jgi:uncharacterized protein (TIGR02246 family)